MDNDFERLKRYNIAEIYDPTVVETVNRVEGVAETAPPQENSETGG